MSLHNPVGEPQIPQSITRDTEFRAADAAHLEASNPHSQYRLSSLSGSKEKWISGSVNNSAGDTGVIHNITGTIVGLQCLVTTPQGWKVPPGFVNTGLDYFAYVTSTHFIIYIPGSGATSSSIMGRPFTALITYT